MVNVYISDLFFNYEHGDCAVYDNGHFVKYDREAMTEKAKELLSCLNQLGVDDLPNPKALVKDFYSRL